MKVKSMLLFFSGFMAIAMLFSCYYDKYDALYKTGTGNCDTSSVISYSQKVVPLLQQQCYSCHSTANAGGGIVMGTYAADKAIALNGKLYGSITWTGGISPMPKGGGKMNSCSISAIRKWIDAGALNN